jgi:glycerol-3-phosphate dehydrogenase
MNNPAPSDLFIIGGGINGTGIARDASGRGLSVVLAEMDDLASATSSSSTKLFHGGLRYLEYFEFRLVREALQERETLLKAMPHISWPMRFVLPNHKDMRYENTTPASRLLSVVMPWMKGQRPAWMIRFGLFLYDHIGGRKILPGTTALDLSTDPAGECLNPRYRKAYEYSDCWVEDSRLVVLNARDAQMRGATILTRTRVVSARREGDVWRIETRNNHGKTEVYHARALVNAAGPWVKEMLQGPLEQKTNEGIRLVRGSHIVTKRLYDHDKAYLFQGTDGRIIFAIPYENDFTLIGTTDADHDDADTRPVCTEGERDYLCEFASRYFKTPVTAADVVWSYSGVRPLYDDGSSSASAATRDYVLTVMDTGGKAPLLNIFGGKITTYRRLAESAMEKLEPYFPGLSGKWTAGVSMPGGDFAVTGTEGVVKGLKMHYSFLDGVWATRLMKAYGTDAFKVLGAAKTTDDLGPCIGLNLYGCEVDWLVEHEFARSAEDILWRRSKTGLRFTSEQVERLENYLETAHSLPG